MESIFLKLFFPPSPSIFINVLSVVNIPSMLMGGISELRGQNMKYSKFSNIEKHDFINSGKDKKETKVLLPSKMGMFVCYTPAFLASLVLFWILPHEGNARMLMLNSALAIHFFKRIFEVQFVHKYSGTMVLETSLMISLGYFTSTSTMIYSQHLAQGLMEPIYDLKNIGVALFLMGISGNLYHHNILSKLREKTSEYKIPKGGLFGIVICPHYMFEVIEFLGLFLISQTPHSFSVALGTMFYLVGRSCATRQWYISKFENFPMNVKAIIPYLL